MILQRRPVANRRRIPAIRFSERRKFMLFSAVLGLAPGLPSCLRTRDNPREPAMLLSSPFSQAVAALVKRFAGRLLQPFDDGYDEARRVEHPLVDRRALLIALQAHARPVVDGGFGIAAPMGRGGDTT